AISRSSPVPASIRRRSAGTGSADMTSTHLGHSVLPISMVSGPPCDLPWRRPARMRTSSCSNFMRAPRPWPRRRRARAAWTSAVVTSTPAGRPSRMPTRAGPCDSPEVSQRSMGSILPRQPRGALARPRLLERREGVAIAARQLGDDDVLALGVDDLALVEQDPGDEGDRRLEVTVLDRGAPASGARLLEHRGLQPAHEEVA